MQRTLQSFFLALLLGSLSVFTAPAGWAQAPPDEAHIYAEGPTSMAIEFTACQTSDEPNCYLNFSIYRNPPGFTQSPVLLESINAEQASHTVYDLTVKSATTYSYQVCAGGLANSSRSNCIPTNSLKTPVPAPPPPGNNGPPNDGNNGKSGYAPPSNLQITATASSVYLKWTNPTKGAIADSLGIYRTTGATVYELVKSLGRMTTNYTDTPMPPHTAYLYAVCDGQIAPVMDNCVRPPHSVTTWGANPVLSATRVTPTTVKLSVAVDSNFELSEILVTRQGSDDPCRQGGTLGNSTQGCRTQTVGPNGVLVNGPTNVTVADIKNAFGSSTATPPYMIELPDDTTVKPGVQYFYVAHVTWVGPLGADSEVATVAANSVQSAPAPSKLKLGEGIKPMPSGGGKPAPVAVPRAPARSAAAAVAPEAAGPSLDSTIAAVNAKPGDAQALYTLGQSYCSNRMTEPCVSVLYMAYLQAEKAGNAALSAQIKSSLGQKGVTVGTEP